MENDLSFVVSALASIFAIDATSFVLIMSAGNILFQALTPLSTSRMNGAKTCAFL